MKQPSSPAAMPSGSVYSTAHDLGLYLQSHLGRDDLAAGSPAMYATLHQPVGGYAMGWWRDTKIVRGGTALVHLGHAPGATSMLVFDPTAGWGVAVIANHQELSTITAEGVGRGVAMVVDGGAARPIRTHATAHLLTGLLAAVVFALLARAVATLGRWRRRGRRTTVRIVWLTLCGLACVATVVFVAGAHARGGETARTTAVYAPDVTLIAASAVVGLFVVTLARAALLVLRTDRPAPRT
jgi:hypothetical protein